MKHLFLLFAMSCMALVGMSQNIDEMVKNQLSNYPKSRLLDIYKSCFQDFMGAEHLVGDTLSVRRYLEYELQQIEGDSLMSWYAEPCGLQGRYVRVSLRVVQEGLVSLDQLLSAFIRSANDSVRPSVEVWKTPDYRAAYRPHYRIVRRDIFERELKPLLSLQHEP